VLLNFFNDVNCFELQSPLHTSINHLLLSSNSNLQNLTREEILSVNQQPQLLLSPSTGPLVPSNIPAGSTARSTWFLKERRIIRLALPQWLSTQPLQSVDPSVGEPTTALLILWEVSHQRDFPVWAADFNGKVASFSIMLRSVARAHPELSHWLSSRPIKRPLAEGLSAVAQLRWSVRIMDSAQQEFFIRWKAFLHQQMQLVVSSWADSGLPASTATVLSSSSSSLSSTSIEVCPQQSARSVRQRRLAPSSSSTTPLQAKFSTSSSDSGLPASTATTISSSSLSSTSNEVCPQQSAHSVCQHRLATSSSSATHLQAIISASSSVYCTVQSSATPSAGSSSSAAIETIHSDTMIISSSGDSSNSSFMALPSPGHSTATLKRNRTLSHEGSTSSTKRQRVRTVPLSRSSTDGDIRQLMGWQSASPT
jgi:hypothetical protein